MLYNRQHNQNFAKLDEFSTHLSTWRRTALSPPQLASIVPAGFQARHQTFSSYANSLISNMRYFAISFLEETPEIKHQFSSIQFTICNENPRSYNLQKT